MPLGKGSCGPLDGFEGPDHDVLALGEMTDRLAVQLDPVRRHGVERDHDLGRAELPGRVVDLGAVQPAAVVRVEAVALGQEMLERARLRLEQGATGRPVSRLEDERPLGVAARVGELESLSPSFERRARVEVRQPVRPAGRG